MHVHLLSTLRADDEGCVAIIIIIIILFTLAEAFKHMVAVRYSEQGSNFYPLEQQAWVHFVDFKDECAGVWITVKNTESVYLR